MEKKLFYNPIWMPFEEDIYLWSCEVAKQVQIKSVHTFQNHLEYHYKQVSNRAFEEHGAKIYKWYNDLIDDNYWYSDPNTLIDCLVQSDKFMYQWNILKQRVSKSEMPEFIIGSEQARNIYEGVNLYDLFYLYYEFYVF